MKVLFLTNIPSPYRVDFFNELGKECDLTVLYERKAASDRDSKWNSEKAKNFKEVFLKGKNIRSDAAICFDVVKWLKKDKFDVFVVGGYSTPTGMLAIQMLKMKKIPFIINSDGGFIKQDKRITYIIKRYFISSANWWLSTGEMTNKYLEHYGAKKEKIFVYPFTSIREKEIIEEPLDEGDKKQLREELKLTHSKVAISVGRYIYGKGYDVLINAWKEAPKDWVLLIIGSGGEEDNLREQIRVCELENVQLIGFKHKEELLKYYLASDLFILPTREDVWGLVINEAMACGLPIITTDKCIAGIELIGKYNNGVISEIQELNKTVALIDQIDLQKQSIASLKGVIEYTIEKMAKEHMKIFKQVINSSLEEYK